MENILIDLEILLDNSLIFLGDYGFIIILLFGIIHPLTENPLSLFTLTLSISILGLFWGYVILFAANMIGVVMLFFLAEKFNHSTNGFLFKRRASEKVLNWIRTTETWRHIIVIGVPFIPTYPIKLAVPLSKVSFKKYMVTLGGAYVFLFFGNSLLYFGILGFITNNIPSYISLAMLLVFALFVYFGIDFFKKNIEENQI
ncbi:MAG: VTT domain-containing protein [Candidatus Izemoplasma sp.]